MSDQTNPRILIADDLEINRELLKNMCRGYGRIEYALNGREVVEKVQAAKGEQDPFGVVFLDILMPEMDGQEALKTLRSLEEGEGLAVTEQTPVVMVSTLGDWDNVLESYKKGGAEEYLTKPITKQQVVEVLQRVLKLDGPVE